MDSIIPLGQKNTLAEYMILSSADNRPPMLDKDLYDSWKSQMATLHAKQRALGGGRMILESVENGPLIWPTIAEIGLTRTKEICPLKPTINLKLPLIEKQALFRWQGIVQQVQGDKASYSLLARPRNATWYKDKAMLAKAQEPGQILDEKQLAFLVDPGVPDGQAVQTIIPNNAAFQTEDFDTYASDCDDISNAIAVLMPNISNYGSNVISEVPHSETYLNDMENQSVSCNKDF
ncbi:hypothetical protein Tco_0640329 [Tanacetum coccineum]